MDKNDWLNEGNQKWCELCSQLLLTCSTSFGLKMRLQLLTVTDLIYHFQQQRFILKSWVNFHWIIGEMVFISFAKNVLLKLPEKGDLGKIDIRKPLRLKEIGPIFFDVHFFWGKKLAPNPLLAKESVKTFLICVLLAFLCFKKTRMTCNDIGFSKSKGKTKSKYIQSGSLLRWMVEQLFHSFQLEFSLQLRLCKG